MAVLLTWALFLAWSFVGLAVLRLGRHRWKLGTLLLAPTVGFAALAVPAYILVRFGVPVRLSAAPVLIAALAASGVALWRARPARARATGLWRQWRPLALVLAAAFALTGWPLFQYGFDWVANGNEDMANYCLVATGYRDHAFASVPKVEDVSDIGDGTQPYWFFYILFQVRSGSEVLLALTSACTGLSAPQAFMPVTLALNLALVSAACGLARLGAGRRAALITGGLLAVSGASTFGVIQQLIAQVGGLALLCTSLALVADRFGHLGRAALARRAGACGVVFGGLALFYPEVIPLLVGACVVMGVRDLARRRLDRSYVAHAGAAIAVMAALLPVYLYGCVSFLKGQSGHSAQNAEMKLEVFPYYMTPRGAAMVWGLLPGAGQESAPLQNACIVAGFLLLLALLGPAARGVARRRAFASALAVVAGLAVALYAMRDAFGLFKLALFAQPFLWATVGAWVAARRTRWAAAAALAVLAAVAGLNARVQYWYVDQSRGRDYRVELPATDRRAMGEFRKSYSRHVESGGVDRVLLATENGVLMKLLAAEVRPVPIEQAGIDPLSPYVEFGLRHVEESPWLKVHREWAEPFRTMRREYLALEGAGRASLRDPDTGRPLHKLLAPPSNLGRSPPERVLVMAGGGGMSVLNRTRYPEDGPPVVCEPLSELRNFAVLVDATGARQYALGRWEPQEIAAHQLEPDPAFRRRTMAGVGPAMVLKVLNPSPRVRVVVGQTNSFAGEPAKRSVAPVSVVGRQRVPLGAVGSGSSRLVSPPLSAQEVGGEHYLAVEFGRELQRNANRLASVERLWGEGLPRDRRWLSGHARDVSVISEEEYAAFQPPPAVRNFPADLTNPQLEYSGFFEEGWVGAEAKLRVARQRPDDSCVVRGTVPGVTGGEGFRTELTLLIDGAPAARRVLGPGDFELRAPGGTGTGPRWVELRFSQTQVLPAPDGRSCAAQVRFAGFEPHDPARDRPPEKLESFPADLGHPKLEQSGIWADGWAAGALRARLAQAAAGGEVVFRGQVPEVAGNAAFRTEVVLLVDGQEVARRALGPGDFELRAPAGKTAQARWVECRFTSTQALPPPDGRGVGAHVRFLGFEPPRPGP
jgi:hypothetical protein